MNNGEQDPFSIKPGPFDKDVLEGRKVTNEEKGVLSEKDFIQESPKTPMMASIPLWIWLALLSLAIALIWGGMDWLQGLIKTEIRSKPFLEVTNRDFSLFLWQFPEFMRSHVKEKTGYLPGFQFVNKETMDLAKTEEFVSAPPEVLFLYHTWNRLLAPDFIARSIPPTEFQEFLNQVEEWQPKYWKGAPPEYAQLIESRTYLKEQDLQKLPQSVLPLSVRRAFVGWKNYFKEGPIINQLTPTFAQVESFLQQHPTYARNYWRNIQEVKEHEVAGKDYLVGLMQEQSNSEEVIPKEQLAPFLKVALFNAEQSQKKL